MLLLCVQRFSKLYIIFIKPSYTRLSLLFLPQLVVFLFFLLFHLLVTFIACYIFDVVVALIIIILRRTLPSTLMWMERINYYKKHWIKDNYGAYLM